MSEAQLKDFKAYDIDWEMTPEAAVTLYLEWGNNCWLNGPEFRPVRNRSDSTTYFVVNAWEKEPTIRLVHRTNDEAKELLILPMPAHLKDRFMAEVGNNKGTYTPTEEIKEWLRGQMDG